MIQEECTERFGDMLVFQDFIRAFAWDANAYKEAFENVCTRLFLMHKTPTKRLLTTYAHVCSLCIKRLQSGV